MFKIPKKLFGIPIVLHWVRVSNINVRSALIMKKRIIPFFSILSILSLTWLSFVSCKDPIPPPPPPTPVSFTEFTPSITSGAGNYTLTADSLELRTTTGSTFRNNSIYRTMSGTNWSATVKIAVNFTANDQQLVGFALGAPDGSVVANTIGWTTEWPTSGGPHLGIWSAKGNTDGTATGGVLTLSGNNVTTSSAGIIDSVYMRVTRTGNIIEAYYSPNGTAFTKIGDSRELKPDYRGDLRLYLYAWANTGQFTCTFSEYGES